MKIVPIAIDLTPSESEAIGTIFIFSLS
jgi:hypothetical protein